MKRIFCSIIIAFTLLPIASSPWQGGYDTAISGTNMNDSDSISLRVSWMPYSSEHRRTNISAGVLVSNPFYQPVSLSADISVSFSFLIMHDHFLTSSLARAGSWYGQVEAGMLIPASEPEESKVYATISPFTLFFGEKLISVASPGLLLNLHDGTVGWRMTIVKITHYLW